MAAILPFLMSAWSGLRSAASAFFGFVSRPPGLYIALVALVLATVWGSGELGYRRGDAQGTADCEARHTAAAAVEHVRQLEVGSAVTAASETRTTASRVGDAKNQEIVEDVKVRAQNLPPPPEICPPAVSGILADRLRSLQ